MAKITAHGCHELARHEILQHVNGRELRTVFVLRSDGALLERSMARDIGETEWTSGGGNFSVYQTMVTRREFTLLMKKLTAGAQGLVQTEAA